MVDTHPDPAVRIDHRAVVRATIAMAACVVASCSDPNKPETQAPDLSIETLIGNGQFAPVSTALPNPIVVLVTDSAGAGVPEITVRFLVVAGGGSVTPDSALTDSQGVALTSWTLGAQTGTQRMVARALAPGGDPVTTDVQAGAYVLNTSYTRLSGAAAAYGVSVNGAGTVYATLLNSAQVLVASASTRTATDTIDVGFAPTGVTFNPSGTEAYVTNQLSQNVGVIDVATNTQVATIPVAPYDPFVVAFSPSGATAYVANNLGMVYAVSTASRTIVDSVFTGNGANGLALTADGATLYVSAFASDAVYEIPIAGFDVARTFTMDSPQGMVISPDGTELYVTSEAGHVFVVHRASGAIVDSVPLPGVGFGLTLKPDGSRLYATVWFPSGQVIGIDRAARTIVEIIPTGGDPRRLAFSADGQTLVVANQAGWIDIVP